MPDGTLHCLRCNNTCQASTIDEAEKSLVCGLGLKSPGVCEQHKRELEWNSKKVYQLTRIDNIEDVPTMKPKSKKDT